jgi:hypothetical protein
MGARRSALALAAALLLPSLARADADAFFRGCEVKRRAAQVAGDTRALGALLADGMQYVHSNGQADSKASLLERIGSGELRYRSIVADEEHYACRASACEVTGKQTQRVTAEGRDLTLHSDFTASWIRAGDSCQLVAYQSRTAGAA